MSFPVAAGIGHNRAPGGGGAFTPVSLFDGSENGGWWDASDLTTMFQNFNGTTPVTTIGQRTGFVADKSGVGDGIRADANDNTRPVYLSGGGVQMQNSEGRRLTAVLSSSITSAAFYTAIIMRPGATEAVGNARYLSYSAASQQDWNSDNRCTAMYTNGGSMTTYRNGALSSVPYTVSALALFECVFDGTNHTMFINEVPGAVLAKTAPFNFNLIGFGCEPLSSAGTNHVNGQFMEAVSINRVLTTGELTDTRSYLRTKWGV